MGCFSLGWLESILVWLVIVCAVVAILKLLVPFILAQIGAAGGVVASIINIVLYAIIAIAIIYIAFSLIACLSGGSILPPSPHR